MSTNYKQAVWTACCEIVGKEPSAAMDMQTNVFDFGLDSLGLAELVIRLEEAYGEGSISIDDIIASPVMDKIAGKLSGGAIDTTPTAPAVVATAVAVPSSAGGDAVMAVWKACSEIVDLGSATPNAQANLFDIGLDSLGLAELVIQLEEAYGEGSIVRERARQHRATCRSAVTRSSRDLWLPRR